MATSDEDTIAQRLERMLADARADAAREAEADRAWAATATWDDVDALARKLVAANEAAEASVAGVWKESVRHGQRLATVHEVRRMDPRQLKAAGLVIRDKWPGELLRGWTIRVLIKVTEDLREMERRGREHRLARVYEPGITRVELDSLAFATDFDWAVAQVRTELRAIDGLGVRLKRVRPKKPTPEQQEEAKTPAQRSPRLKLSRTKHIDEAIKGAVKAFMRPRRRGRPEKVNEGSPGDAMVKLWTEMGLRQPDTLALNMANKAIARELDSTDKWSELEWAKTSQGWAPRK